MIPIRYLGAGSVYHQKHRLSIILKGGEGRAIETALKRWREGAPPTVIMEDRSPLRPQSRVPRTHTGCKAQGQMLCEVTTLEDVQLQRK